MRLVPIESIREGSFLAKTIYDNDGRILLKTDAALTNNILKKIKSFGIYSLYIKDNYSKKEIEDIIRPEIRQKCVKTLKDTFNSFYSFNLVSLDKKVILKKESTYFQKIHQIANELLEELLSQKNIMINIVDIKSMDNYTYQHSVNVAVLSLVLGINLKLTKSELNNLCVGALLHDIGKVLIPKDIIQKESSLTQEEYKIIKTHTTKGYDYLKNNYTISVPSRIIVLQHHERIDGNGYPEGVKNEKINRFSKIVSIADVYDALTSDRPYRKAMCPNDAIEYIQANCETQFDYNMVRSFSSVIVPYPPGTLVKLSNEDIAVVESTYPKFPLRPKVKIIKSNNRDNINKSIELLKDLNIVIEDVLYNV